MIPELKQEAVARALRKAFDTDAFEDIRALTAGLSSALVFRILVRGRPYLLRVITRTDAMSDPTRWFACMTSAADVGIAPRIWYTNVEDRIAITDYVEARPLPLGDAVVRLAATLRTLHALPRFPLPRTGNYLDAMDSFVQRFRAAKILPESETEELFQLYGRLLRVYPRDDADMVSSHNDLKPENMLFDGERVWLVDWEAAFLNDRYHDLAVVANFVVTNQAQEEQLLQAYFGEPAGEYRLARFYLMRQLLHHFYTVVFLLIGSSGQPIERKPEAPAFREFHEDIWAGRLDLASNEMKLQYGIVHMNQALRNMHGARLRDALQIVAGRHAAA